MTPPIYVPFGRYSRIRPLAPSFVPMTGSPSRWYWAGLGAGTIFRTTGARSGTRFKPAPEIPLPRASPPETSR